MEDSPRGYASIWDNREGGNSVTVKTSAASSDDLF
jgi:hypothetical protein